MSWETCQSLADVGAITVGLRGHREHIDDETAVYTAIYVKPLRLDNGEVLLNAHEAKALAAVLVVAAGLVTG
jgi:hypothetical protein